jgi:hypothetical protein
MTDDPMSIDGDDSRYLTFRPVRRMSVGWGATLGAFWAFTSLGLIAVSVSSNVIGRPVWWTDDGRWSPPILGLLSALVVAPSAALSVWSFLGGRRADWLSTAIVIEFVVLAIVERHDSPGASAVLVVLAIAAALAAIASVGARRVF